MMRSKFFITILSCVILMLSISSCNHIEEMTNSSAAIVINSITGNDLDGTSGSTTIFCDVLTSGGTVLNDTADIEVFAYLLDPGDDSVSTFYQDIIIDQVDVAFSRADGLSVEGRDVPYRFSQKVNARVTINGSLQFSIVLVQHTAKMEPPLSELVYVSQAHILKLEATITVHGRDVSGNRIKPAVGTVSVWCANFGDSEGSGGSEG